MSAEVTLDLDRLADVLRSLDTMSNVDVALEVADIGVPMLPTVPGGRDPMLTRLRIDGTKTDKSTGEIIRIAPPCLQCKRVGLTPANEHGATTDLRTISRYWSTHPDTGVGMKDHPNLIRRDGDFESAAQFKKARHRIGYGQSDGEPEPFSAYTPGGQYRRRFLHYVESDTAVTAGGGTSVLGVSWYGSRHPTGGGCQAASWCRCPRAVCSS